MPTVLVIEDSKLLRAMIQRLLGKAGYSVVSAADGEQGLRIVRDQKPDLVLLDMLLPKVGGEEVLRRLKLDKETAGVPVVVLTSLSQKNQEKLQREGADAFLEKEHLNDNPQPLLQTVERLLLKAVSSGKGS
jgi:CheY-like chemotaxis protein